MHHHHHEALNKVSNRILVMIIGVLALIVAVGVQSYRVPRQNARNARIDCMQTTESRVIGARKAAAEYKRELRLSQTPGEPAEIEHSRSAVEAERQARALLELSGVTTHTEIDDILSIDPLNPYITAQRQKYCNDLYKLPSVW